MTAQMILDVGPITFTTPSSTRFYFQPAIVLVNSTIDMLDAYSDPFQGKDMLQPQTYLAYSVDLSGNLSPLNGITSWINAFSPQTVPAFSLNYAARAFNGPSSGSDFAEYFDTINMDGTATFRVAVVDMSGASPVVHTVGTSITVNPVPKTLTDNITGELGDLTNGNNFNEEIFEVAGAPSAGTITGTFMIFDSAGNVVTTTPHTGFNFTDGKAHVFGVGGWNKTSFGELVEVWNGTTNLADLQLSTINASTGAVTTGWTAATELTTVTHISWQFISPGGAGMIVVADGSDAGGRGFFQYVIDDSSSTGGTGGTIFKSLATHYTGTVTQDARIFGSGIANEYVLDWVDANGLTLELIDSSLNVLETYNIAEANGTSLLQNLGDGRLFVTYRVQTSTSSVDKYVILDTRLTNPPPPPGTIADMILRHGADGVYEIYDLGNNAIVAASRLGQVGTDWQFVTLGGFNGNDTTDMLLRNSTSGGFEVYDISNNNITNAAFLGTVGMDWQVMGFGNFSSFGETDMILRNMNTGGVEVYDLRNNQIIGAAFMGAVGLDWQFSGVGNFSGRGTSDMLLRNSNTGGLEVYDINSNQITGAAFIGTVGLDWQFSGVGNFSGVPGETDLLLRNINFGGLEVYDINNNQLTGAAFIGTVGLDWQFAGIAPIHAPGASDLVLRNVNTGAFEVYDIAGNTLVGAASMGAVGLDWSLGGFAADPPTGSTGDSSQATQLVQAMAGFGGASGASHGLNAVALGSDTSQQPLLTTPQHG